MKRLIVNADDFGSSQSANHAVVRANREGILTTASLMIGEPAAFNAVELAREIPELGVGLHLVTVVGHAVLEPAEIPLLANQRRELSNHPAVTWLRYSAKPAVRRQLYQELDAQFGAFAATGLPWDHVDGHLHFHSHPAIWDYMLARCEEYKVPGVRIPDDDYRVNFRISPELRWAKLALSFVFTFINRRCRRALRGRKFISPSHSYGMWNTGNMREAYILKLLPELEDGLSEIYFHPGTQHARKLSDRADGMDTDLHSLLSDKVREAIESNNIQLTRYWAEIERIACEQSIA